MQDDPGPAGGSHHVAVVIVDRDGRVGARIVGATTYTKLRRLVEEVLAEPT